MRFKSSLSNKVLLLVAIPLSVELIFIALLGHLLKDAEIKSQKAERSRAIVVSASNLTKLTFDSCGSLVAYNLSKGKLFADAYERNRHQIPNELKLLRRLVGDDKQQLESLARVEAISNGGAKLFNDAKQAADGSGLAANLIVASSKNDIEKFATDLTKELETLVTREKNLSDGSPEAESKARDMVEKAIIGGIILNLLVAISLTIYVNRSITSRVMKLNENTKRLANGEPLTPPVGGGDEVEELDDTFREMAAALAESNRVKQEFLEMISHDVRTPLTSVASSLQLIELGANPEKMPTYVAIANKNIDQVIALLNQLLDIHRLESNKLDLVIVETGAAEVLFEAIETISPAAEKLGISIIAAENPVVINCDPDRLGQVFINLLSNALKYSPQNSEIFTSIDSPEGGVKISIRDHGKGVPDEFKVRIFDRFQQVQKSDEVVHGGRGLGLAICKAIVEKHGGKIGVEDAEGGGSTFWVWLPSVQQPPQ